MPSALRILGQHPLKYTDQVSSFGKALLGLRKCHIVLTPSLVVVICLNLTSRNSETGQTIAGRGQPAAKVV